MNFFVNRDYNTRVREYKSKRVRVNLPSRINPRNGKRNIFLLASLRVDCWGGFSLSMPCGGANGNA